MRRINIALICGILLGFTGPAMAHAKDDRGYAEKETALPAPFRVAENVPADATLYLHIEDAATIRRELAGRPIAGWFNETVAAGEAAKVWSQVAQAADLDPAALFDALLGQRMTFVVRNKSTSPQVPRSSNGAADLSTREPVEWALLTEVTAERAEKALAALKPVAHGPRSRMAMLELPEHELLLARRGDLLLIGPRDNKRLFMQMLRSIGGRDADDAQPLAHVLRSPHLSHGAGRNPAESGSDAYSLWLSMAFGEASDRKPVPSLAIFLRHNLPLGGFSIAVAEFASRDSDVGTTSGSQPDLTIQHYGSFDAAPFSRGVAPGEIDCSILHALDSGAALAMVEPNEAGRSSLELFLHAMIGEGLLSPKMRGNLGDRRIVVLGEFARKSVENEPSGPPAAPTPSVAVCYELREAEGAQEQLDRQMAALLARQANRKDARTTFGGFDVSLNWSVAEGSRGGWYVISSHPDQLEQVVSALSAGNGAWNRGDDGKRDIHVSCSLSRTPVKSNLHSAGVVNGPRLAQMLLTLREAAPGLVNDDRQRAELRESMRLMSELAAALDDVRWRLARPSANEVDLEVRIRLAPP